MSNTLQRKDRLFTEHRLPGDFVFDEKVANVFEDMLNRSIPGYSTIIAMIGVLAERYYQENTVVYDLGCSLGGASFSVLQHLKGKPCTIVAIDNSAAMMERLELKKQQFGDAGEQILCQCESIQESVIRDASVVILNFTLQFLAIEEREALIDKIYEGMAPGGVLIVSEKIIFADEHLNELLIDSYHQFKENMGYSKLEISQKRTALENVLIPETLEDHKKRILGANFGSFEVWFQCFNFASMIAFK
ncbi:MAG: carboxy-S-adenosyl-L-methionine synthase CmoA [Gammaproteobacteria bacterium]|nr:carboxy-S-adenosyl-L-methionine synthase CmoA [Gammaproteobacteria bacterium]MDD9897239.1 carboxy-S-adenosyl-L-methionine synthase CmoA [Gammaproteobacteria bacterium]MDD9959180.1 carboxy-S-adenosyl-L-methionine synthase CmoA [Gammaproteobacteria bacterium]